MNKNRIIILAVIIVLAWVALYSLRGMMTPYVPFKEAMAVGEYVQVIGKLRGNIPVRNYEGHYAFRLADRDGAEMDVIHRGTRPQNFEHAEQVVLLGKFDKEKRVFEADRVLVKCPSKYQKVKQP